MMSAHSIALAIPVKTAKVPTSPPYITRSRQQNGALCSFLSGTAREKVFCVNSPRNVLFDLAGSGHLK